MKLFIAENIKISQAGNKKMPHIRIRSLTDSQVQILSKVLPVDLSEIVKTPIDNFTVELVATQFYKDGKMVNSDPMIEILWFDRGPEIQELCAQKVTQHVQKISESEYIAVVFTALAPKNYYENGKHFG